MIKTASLATSARSRALLLATAATMSIVIAGSAQAQSANLQDPTNAYRAAQDSVSEAPTSAFLERQHGYAVAPVSDYIEPQVVIAGPPGTPTTARDPVNVTGVGQMIVDTQDGFIGLCTGTLINPRTVIFAAHCVNEMPANAYGQNSGGRPIGFGFGSNNNVAGASAFGGYLGNYATNPGRYMYDANYVAYNPLSLEPDSAGFLYGDIAMASLDTPAAGIPTWALLFSQLPDPNTATAAGTGYHVVIDGYGNNGTGTTGSTGGIDYRRRIAENMIGGLASLNDFEGFIFGSPNDPKLTQNLYWIDFDDPRRGTLQASMYDFNAWRDNAVIDANGVAKEGITASGDSGGPLILDRTYTKQLVIGVLSGGYTRFFGAQPPNGYGTASFYQPLYLYWDWIAANNPYHYVSAVAGNGNWTDAAHWVTNLDPNYYIINGNQAVNGLPTTPGAGTTDQPGYGQACFESGGVSDCLNISNGTETVALHPIGQDPATGTASNDKAIVSVATLDGQGTQVESQSTTGSQQAQGQVVPALPPATLANGRPGATNFVPNNDDGNRLTSTAPRYFDVTLSAAGTTTLNTNVTIDRFTIAGGTAALDITSTGRLTSLMGVTQATGSVNVNGTLVSGGDYLMMTGGLSGSGTIRAPFFTSVAGTIAPGTPTTTGTLTFQGNLVLASGNLLMINLGANGVSDLFKVTGAGDYYTFLTTERPIDGTTKFLTPAPISAILTPRLTYQAQSVSVTIDAGLYANVVANTPVQTAYARLLDQDRIVYNDLRDLYGILDMQNAATIRSTLEGLAPRAETTRQALATASVDNTGRFYRDRLASLEVGNLGGTVAMIGKPFQIAALASSGMPGTQETRSDAGGGMVSQEGKLPETMSAFVAGGYIDGHSASMPTAVPLAGRDQFNGWFVAAGLEADVGERALLGFSFAYTDLDSTPSFVGQEASSTLFQGTLYGKVKTHGGLFLDGTFSAGVFDSRTVRNVSLAGTNYRLVGKDQSLFISGEVGAGGSVPVSSSIVLDPRVSLRATRIMFDTINETGGGPALVYKPGSLDSVQTRAGFNAHGNSATVKPYVSAYWVHDFGRQPGFVGANFVGGVGPNALFAVAGSDNDWAEASAGLTFSASDKVSLSVGANTTIGRSDVTNQSYHGTITFAF
jgi:V8-like Glu-specific endopeptidase